jgi:hypothetical protein
MHLSEAFRVALQQPFSILLRLDTDALLIGDDYRLQAARALADDPSIGAFGSFRRGFDGGERSREWARRQLLMRTVAAFVLSPRSFGRLLTLMAKAKVNGYAFGDAVLGGACIYSYQGIRALADNNMLGCKALAWTHLEEDHIFGLCLYACGMRLMDFGWREDDLPMGVKHKGLPASPAELVERRKSIVHSTKYFGSLDEAEVRATFRRLLGVD